MEMREGQKKYNLPVTKEVDSWGIVDKVPLLHMTGPGLIPVSLMVTQTLLGVISSAKPEVSPKHL